MMKGRSHTHGVAVEKQDRYLAVEVSSEKQGVSAPYWAPSPVNICQEEDSL